MGSLGVKGLEIYPKNNFPIDLCTKFVLMNLSGPYLLRAGNTYGLLYARGHLEVGRPRDPDEVKGHLEANNFLLGHDPVPTTPAWLLRHQCCDVIKYKEKHKIFYWSYG